MTKAGRIIARSSEDAGCSAPERRAGTLELSFGAAANRQFRNRHVPRQRVTRRLDVRHQRADVRKVSSLRRPDVVVHQRLIRFTPRQRVVDHRRVIAVRMAHRTHESILIRHRRQSRKMLADLRAGHVRRDRLKRTTNL